MSSKPPGTARIPFLLAQLGSHVSGMFEQDVRETGLTPSEAGVLRLLARTPGLSQRELATRLNTQPSRVVALIDGLQSRGLVTRQRSESDRRNYELHATAASGPIMQTLRGIAEKNAETLLADLEPAEQQTLLNLLLRLARSHGLDADLHRDTLRPDPDSAP